MGVYHSISVKHLDRYLCEFTGRRETRPLNTSDQLGLLVQAGIGKRLRYADLVAPKRNPQPRMI